MTRRGGEWVNKNRARVVWCQTGNSSACSLLLAGGSIGGVAGRCEGARVGWGGCMSVCMLFLFSSDLGKRHRSCITGVVFIFFFVLNG